MNLRFAAIAAAVLTLAGVASSQDESTFKVYGFTDMSFMKMWLDDNALLRSEGFDNKGHINLDNVNIYTDFSPNARTRALVEIGYKNKPVQLSEEVGQIIRIPGMPDQVRAAKAAPSNEVDLGTIKTEWGSFSIERAHFETKLNQQFNLKFGKFITPYGVWNVDHGSPVLLTIRQPYEVGLVQLFPKSQVGIAENGRVFLGETDIDYTVYISNGRQGVKLGELQDLAGGANLNISLPILSRTSIGFSGYSGVMTNETSTQIIEIQAAAMSAYQNERAAYYQSNAGYLAGLQSKAIASGLTDPAAIGAYVVQQVTNAVTADVTSWVTKQATNPDNHTYTTTNTNKSREIDIGANLCLQQKGFGLQTEINYQHLNNLLTGSDKTTSVLGYYFLGSYAARFSDDFTLTPYAMYERIQARGTTYNPGVNFFGTDIGGFQIVAAGFNFKFFGNFVTKIEYSYVQLLTGGNLADVTEGIDGNALALQFALAF